MTRMAILTALILALAPLTFAQTVDDDDWGNRGEVGVFGQYFRHEHTDNNFIGLGGRVSFNVHPNVALEGELAYDFARAFNEAFDDGATITVQRTDVGVLHGLFGPKFQTSGRTARVFGVIKGGFVTFNLDDPATLGNVIGTLDDLRQENTKFALFPGVGFEAFAGPIGVRFDVGDQIYWSGGDTRHNLKITFGPHFQF